MAVPVAAAGAMPFLQALFSTKAGLQAIGMTASAIPKIAALTGADPKKVGKLSQAANFLNLGLQIGGAGIDIANKKPNEGTPLTPGEKEIDKNFAKSMNDKLYISGEAVESIFKSSPGGLGGMLGAAAQGKTDDLMKLPFGTNLQELVSPSQDLQINKDVFSMFQQ